MPPRKPAAKSKTAAAAAAPDDKQPDSETNAKSQPQDEVEPVAKKPGRKRKADVAEEAPAEQPAATGRSLRSSTRTTRATASAPAPAPESPVKVAAKESKSKVVASKTSKSKKTEQQPEPAGQSGDEEEAPVKGKKKTVSKAAGKKAAEPEREPAIDAEEKKEEPAPAKKKTVANKAVKTGRGKKQAEAKEANESEPQDEPEAAPVEEKKSEEKEPPPAKKKPGRVAAAAKKKAAPALEPVPESAADSEPAEAAAAPEAHVEQPIDQPESGAQAFVEPVTKKVGRKRKADVPEVPEQQPAATGRRSTRTTRAAAAPAPVPAVSDPAPVEVAVRESKSKPVAVKTAKNKKAKEAIDEQEQQPEQQPEQPPEPAAQPNEEDAVAKGKKKKTIGKAAEKKAAEPEPEPAIDGEEKKEEPAPAKEKKTVSKIPRPARGKKQAGPADDNESEPQEKSEPEPKAPETEAKAPEPAPVEEKKPEEATASQAVKRKASRVATAARKRPAPTEPQPKTIEEMINAAIEPVVVPELPVVSEPAVEQPQAMETETSAATSAPVEAEPVSEKKEDGVKPLLPPAPTATGRTTPKKRMLQESPTYHQPEAKKARTETIPIIKRPSISGRLFSFGTDTVGELGLRSTGIERLRPFLIPSLDGELFSLIAAGAMHSVAVTTDGLKVYTFGCNDEHALGRSTVTNGETAAGPDANKETGDPDETELEAADVPEAIPSFITLPHPVVKVTAGDSHTVALTNQGTLYVWGCFRSQNGRMREPEKEPKQLLVGDGEVISDIASGDNHLLILTESGKVYTIGCGEQGALGRFPREADAKIAEDKSNVEPFLTPGVVQIRDEDDGSDVRCDRVWAGSFTSFARCSKTGSIYAWGLNNYGQLGFPVRKSIENADIIVEFIPRLILTFSKSGRPVDSDKKIVSVCGGQHHSLFLDAAGRVYSCGRWHYGRLGHGLKEDVHIPKLIQALSNENVTAIDAGIASSFAICESGFLYSWGMKELHLGHKMREEDNDEDYPLPRRIKSKNLDTAIFHAVSVGSGHTLVIATLNASSSQPQSQGSSVGSALPAENGSASVPNGNAAVSVADNNTEATTVVATASA